MFEKILFCTDFSENSNYAFSYASNLTTAYHATLFCSVTRIPTLCILS